MVIFSRKYGQYIVSLVMARRFSTQSIRIFFELVSYIFIFEIGFKDLKFILSSAGNACFNSRSVVSPVKLLLVTSDDILARYR